MREGDGGDLDPAGDELVGELLRLGRHGLRGRCCTVETAIAERGRV